MKKIYLLIICLTISLWQVQAQNQNSYKATVTDTNGGGIPGATINEKGTNNYAVSAADGSFQLKTTAKDFTLVVQSVGYVKKEIAINDGRVPDNIILETDLMNLDEVVVTALGIEREKQSLASSIAEIDKRQLTDVPMTNMVNSLAGQVAGVQITNGSSGVGSSSRIIIRGENSLTGTNQPLFVVDGVPISNEQITSDLVNNGSLQEVDYGNGGAEINPDDIESISILKGAGSAALYGSRAANGVVLITTKRGTKQQGIGVTTSSAITFETLLTLPEYQNEYGGGIGDFSFNTGLGALDGTPGIFSYGPKLDGSLISQFDGPSTDANGNPVRGGDVIARRLPDGSLAPIEPTPWVARPDNIRNFFETGVTSQHNIAVNSSGDNGKIRLAYSNLRNEGILPNTDLSRDGLAISLDQRLTNKLSVNSFVNYINSRSSNRPNLGYGYENVMYGFNWLQRQTNIESLKDYWQAGQEGREQFNYNYAWVNNPYFTLYENTNSFNKDRVLGNASANYDFTEKLSLSVRTGVDIYNDRRAFKRALSTNANPTGSYREDNVVYKEINTDFLLSYNDRLNEDFKYGVSVGSNRFNQSIAYKYTEASQLSLPNIYTLANSKAPLVGNNELFEKRINSVYGIGNVAFRNALYFDFTLRNDWSSTLPQENNSFAYYSAGLSYILTNMFELPESINYLKLRLSAASAGNDTDPYQLRNTYTFNQNYGEYLRVTNQNTLKNSNLKPERLNAYEAGVELWFLNNRLQADLGIYENTSIDQIIARPISLTTGYSNKLENGGKVRTRGLEASLSALVIDKPSFKWKVSTNYSTYRSTVIELPEGVEQFITGRADFFGGSGGANSIFYIAKEGGRVGDMYGTGFKKVDGRIVYDQNGLPVTDPNLRLLGNYNPNFSMGLNNEFNYKGIILSALIDWRKGGVFASRTKALGSTSGVLKETLVGRENGIVGDGVVNIGTEESPNYVENTTNISAYNYNNQFYSRGNEESSLYDASYIKLRQLSLYYTLNKAFSKRIGFQNIRLGFIGNNLLLITENPHVDPELNASQGRAIVYGVDDMSYPSTRSFGFSIKTQF
ncbi:SusC/RagA family TonB-linked outer membrane protein [Marivirga atlantica]|uniref:SusC/RagA family TonB-linked outer membrane protein n=1 Tax=Marivirga atlantica TaxID=1548457 RepID=A0A937AJ97_9BACT|nr:SusC/RagA family TonB-linked outer membrane protein [Marivirga atlantica]MBL0766539.1 SusC/RagA family TonB-linked outer membrane protein [Marivirga atlantica]